MKRSKILVLIICLFIIISCKNNNSDNQEFEVLLIDSCKNAIPFDNAIMLENMVGSDYSGELINYKQGDSTKIEFRHVFIDGNLVQSIFYYDNGNIHEEYRFKCQSIHGNVNYYHKNGKLALIVPYEYGRKNGNSLLYDSIGNLKQQIIFRNNSVVKDETYF
jgi:antitoxin component YwqK of YwqJK toxin-antitoxin module